MFKNLFVRWPSVDQTDCGHDHSKEEVDTHMTAVKAWKTTHEGNIHMEALCEAIYDIVSTRKAINSEANARALILTVVTALLAGDLISLKK